MIIYLRRSQLLPKSSNNQNKCEYFGNHWSSQNSWLSRWAALKNEAGCHRRQESYLMTLPEGFPKLVSFIIIIKIVIIFNCQQNCHHRQLSSKLLSSSIVIIVISISNCCPHRPYLKIVIISSEANFHIFLRIVQQLFACTHYLAVWEAHF